MDKDQQNEIERLLREARANDFARRKMALELAAAGVPEPVALQRTLSIYPTSSPKVRDDLEDAIKKSIHPKEFGVANGGETNYWNGQFKPFTVPETFTTKTNEAGIPVQVSKSGRQYSIPNAPADTSLRAMTRKGIEDANSDEDGRITNSVANVRKQYLNALNPQPPIPTMPGTPSWMNIPAQPPSSPSASSSPSVGTVLKGYEFLGGNPADERNWKKVQ